MAHLKKVENHGKVYFFSSKSFIYFIFITHQVKYLEPSSFKFYDYGWLLNLVFILGLYMVDFDEVAATSTRPHM